MRLRARLFVPVLAASISGAASAQTWVSLNSAKPPGAAAEIVLDPHASTADKTVFDVFVHGFWSTKVTGPDGQTYHRIEVPGLDHLGLVGAPDLPVARVPLAHVTDVPLLQLQSVSILSQVTLPGYVAHPWEKPGNDEPYDPTENPGAGDPNGTSDAFTVDSTIYGAAAVYPAIDAEPTLSARTGFSGIARAVATAYPIKWKGPAASGGELRVALHMRCTVQSLGGVVSSPPISPGAAKLAAATFLNWSEVEGAGVVVANTATYEGRYLVVTPPEYVSALEPFVSHRKATGLEVTVHVLPAATGNTCGAVRAAIDAWRQAGPAHHDHFCLLVGDRDVVPPCPAPTVGTVPSDDPYGSPSGVAHLDEQVFVGRLSVDDPADLAHQVDKILAYELDPAPTDGWRNALLVAHADGAPGKYVQTQQEVSKASYAEPPVFKKKYGSTPGVGDKAVRSEIDQGVGVVAYRGHGTANTWASWNLAGESFHKNDVLDLKNEVTPVVWSFSCTNSSLAGSDSLGEVWLEDDGQGGGGVAHYGSTVVSGTAENDALARRMFEAVYDRGLRVHAHAIAWAEAEAGDEVPGDNAWKYMLLGDPYLRVRTRKPASPSLVAPDEIEVCGGANPCFLTVLVKAPDGSPMPGVLVSAWKPGPPGGPDEVFANAYTGTGGTATIPLGPTTLGSINVTGQDPDGNVFGKGIVTTNGPWADLGFPLPGVNGPPKLSGTGTLQAGTPVSIDLVDAAPNSATILFVSPGMNPLSFEGGTLLPTVAPIVQFAGTTDGSGAASLNVPAWPAGFPSDFEIFFQRAIADAAAPVGVALSNALRATTP